MPGLENNLFKHELISYTEISPAGSSNNNNDFTVSIFIVPSTRGHTSWVCAAWAWTDFSWALGAHCGESQ